MATIAESGLFPPILDNYLPAIDIADIKPTSQEDPGGFTVYFALSSFESHKTAIHSLHISITRQTNYHSLLDSTLYTRGIIVQDFDFVANKTTPSDPVEYQGQNYYKTTIPFSDLNIKEELVYNTYYKLQVRMSKDANPNKTGQELAVYLADEGNLSKFSEWSTVSLLRFIAPRVLTAKIGEKDFPSQSTGAVNVNTSALTLFGKYLPQSEVAGYKDISSYLYNGNNDQEYLANYRVKVYDVDNNLVVDSDVLQPTNFNEINYNIPYFFPIGNSTVILELTTANLNTKTITCTVTASYSHNQWASQSHIAETIGVDTVIGMVGITFEPGSENPIPEGSEIMIRRGESTDNFGYWSTIYTKNITTATSKPFYFNDYTIESGTLYKYEITFTYNKQSYFIVEGPAISVFDHAFLTGEGTQLCVKFNANISNFKRNVSDNLLNTLGGTYPYITRNGHMNYRSFGLSGTIAYEMDAEHQFSTRSDIYGDWIDVYGSYFVNHYMNQRNDRITQRKFREMVMDYLYDDIPKLFRSTPEGNILVRITDVSLTPNQTTGRMIYDFSCTATEIGEANVENYKLYKIQDFGDN